MAELIILGIVLIIGATILIALFLSRKSKIDKGQNEAIKDLERRLTDLMMSQLKEIRDTQNGTSKEMNRQIRSFTKETTQIREDLKGIQDRVKDVSTFQEIFKSPKLRGQWGEASLEHVLSQHFPQELYKRQYLFSSGEQVDAILRLPNGKILPIDSKFSSSNLRKLVYSFERSSGSQLSMVWMSKESFSTKFNKRSMVSSSKSFSAIPYIS